MGSFFLQGSFLLRFALLWDGMGRDGWESRDDDCRIAVMVVICISRNYTSVVAFCEQRTISGSEARRDNDDDFDSLFAVGEVTIGFSARRAFHVGYVEWDVNDRYGESFQMMVRSLQAKDKKQPLDHPRDAGATCQVIRIDQCLWRVRGLSHILDANGNGFEAWLIWILSSPEVVSSKEGSRPLQAGLRTSQSAAPPQSGRYLPGAAESTHVGVE